MHLCCTKLVVSLIARLVYFRNKLIILTTIYLSVDKFLVLNFGEVKLTHGPLQTHLEI